MFQHIFSKTKTKSLDIDKIDLTDVNQLDNLLDKSKEKTILLFKHSTRCGISSMVLKRFENKIKKEENVYLYYFLDLLKYRKISDLIAIKFNVPHQSPQLLIFKNGKVISHGSHFEIMQMDL